MIVPVHCFKPSSPASAAAASALVRAPSFSRCIADIHIPTKARQVATSSLLAVALIIWPTAAGAAEMVAQPLESDTLSNVPQMLSGECTSPKDCKKPRIQRPKSRKAESCTTKCVATCIRGGNGSPGEGPLNIRRPLVVFKQGFRSRKYW